MDRVVRAIDVGFGYTKYTTSDAADGAVRCAAFPSIAYPSTRDPTATPSLERRRTVAIPIAGLFYEVGPEVRLATDNLSATHLHDRYTETPEYLALLRGALAMMKVSSIDLLILGLPVSHFMARKAMIERLAVGTHDLGGGRKVLVHKVMVLAQPQGALMYYAASHQKMATIEHEQSLVIDAGTRTFDWLVSRGMRLVLKVSDSLVRGAADIQRSIAQDIGAEIGTTYTDFDAIDRALRTGKSLMVYQRAFDLGKLMPVVQAAADRAVGGMLERIPADYAFQNIVLVGGAATLFGDAVKRGFPKHRVAAVREPMFANVRGFQVAGANYMSPMPDKAEKR